MYIDYSEREFKSKINSLGTPSNILNWLQDCGLTIREEEKDFSVSLVFEISATTPEKAVKEMISLIESHGLWDWSYSVTDETSGKETEVYAFHIGQDDDDDE